MTVLLALMTASGAYAAWSLLRAAWSILLPRSAWKWDRGAEIKGAEPSFFGLVAQVVRGLRYLVTAAVMGGVTYFLYQLAYGKPADTP